MHTVVRCLSVLIPLKICHIEKRFKWNLQNLMTELCYIHIVGTVVTVEVCCKQMC
jgi:hypothetical protein